jgi:hypothetical protein
MLTAPLFMLDQAGQGLQALLLGTAGPLGMAALGAAALFVLLVVAHLPSTEDEAQPDPLDWSERLGPGRLLGCAAVFGTLGGLFGAVAWKVWEAGAGSMAPLAAGALAAVMLALEFGRRALRARRSRQD